MEEPALITRLLYGAWQRCDEKCLKALSVVEAEEPEVLLGMLRNLRVDSPI